MADLMVWSFCWLNLWLRSYSNLKAKCRPSKSDADHQLEEGKCTDGGHQRFLMNNSSDNIVWQFSYGRFNGTVHLLIEFMVVELFKFKGKMSAAPQVEITWRGENAPMVDTSNSLWIIVATITIGFLHRAGQGGVTWWPTTWTHEYTSVYSGAHAGVPSRTDRRVYVRIVCGFSTLQTIGMYILWFFAEECLPVGNPLMNVHI